MYTTRFYIIISMSMFFVGMLFFAFYNQLIFICIPSLYKVEYHPSETIKKKQVFLHYFHVDRWKVEKQELLWFEKVDRSIYQLINTWLRLLDEERILPKKITLQSVLISQSQCVYLSFDHNIFNKEDIIFKKWMLIEGLLKTLTSNSIGIQEIQFLVHQKPLQDTHLDFSCPWPVQGFMKE